jgi:tripartite ATP-independent transporter DctM subunit
MQLIVEFAPLLMFLFAFAMLLLGYPVALTLAGTALLSAGIGIIFGVFDYAFLTAIPNRLFGIVTNQTLIAVPLFVLMGVILEKSRVAENLLNAMTALFGKRPGGLGFAVTIVGMLMAASTGIVGATVVTMGLMSLPSMLKSNYDPRLATYQQAQLSLGIFNPKTVSVGNLFAGAIVPGLLLVAFYMAYIFSVSVFQPHRAPTMAADDSVDTGFLLKSLLSPLMLIFAVLGSILTGLATPTEAAGIGALGALVLAWFQEPLSMDKTRSITRSTTETTAMVFFILIGASVFSLVFRGYGGDELIHGIFEGMPGGVVGATVIVMIVIFLLGFILDFIEITFVVVPIVGPVLLSMGLDPVWLGIMIAVNLQTSFLTPPFGFALFYLRGVAPATVKTTDIYRGVVPFIMIQILLLILLAYWPGLATWLPGLLYGST